MSNEKTYSGACPEMFLYTMRQVRYWTCFGNGSRFSSLKICSEGVMKCAFKIILAARFYKSCQVSICSMACSWLKKKILKPEDKSYCINSSADWNRKLISFPNEPLTW